ncbi:hypothetical protein TTHERM_01243440 (macronuclear) [Tetrahymena thermophila SB210]|uniref:VWFA domain-containing protein n=1 Tax=Tetrahymena thermophila (strain SB210) TaxID=312017 RepID=Q24BS8_TETTS|nr:hypothetical protein TTHERM_01243440 [Tetrahymena thermophila SB210]EAS05230.2 hypothetical protein TTHERM_01243440 [Tetrahymena thermophila SB210]|eukprot:XP_001025475.2 hypothetical protein TTHERM_01243440 [Tetrahymena thermophila SB210]
MNVAFVIDNSISMNQRVYNGLSLIEIAKNGIEFILKQRMRAADSKYDTYQLFQTGYDPSQKGYPNGVQMLSSYKHDINHLFFQLKNIKTHLVTDLPGTLQNVYRQLNIFRYLNGADNIFGGRDPLKSDPSLIVLFTDESDYYQLEKLQEFIRTNRLQNKWDQTFVVFELVLPSIIEKNILDQEAYRKQLQSHLSIKVFEDVANALGGCTVIVDNYEYLFQVIDTQIIPILNKSRLNIYLQISSRHDQEIPGFIDSGIKEVVNPISNPLLPSKDIVILKIIAKLNKQFQQAKYKPDNQSTQNYSRILLPEKPAKIEDPKKPELMMNDYPKLIVDFSKIFHANMYKELEFERQELELSDWTRLISPQIIPFIKEKAYFPLYCTHEFKFNYEETQSGNQFSNQQLILIGLLRISCKDGQIIGADLLYNIWNFLEFNLIYDEIIQKKNIYIQQGGSTQTSSNMLSGSSYNTNQLPQQVEQELISKLERYFQKTPQYYWPTIRKILVDKNLQQLYDHKYSFLYGDVLQEQDEFTRNMFKFKQKERKKLDEDIKQNRYNHSIKKVACCAPNSENYEFINRQMHPKSSQRVQLENLLLAKEEILFRKIPKIYDSTPQSNIAQNKPFLNAAGQVNGDVLQPPFGIINQQQNSNSYAFFNPKLAKRFIKDDYIKRIHYKSEPVSKMSELLRSVKQQEHRDPQIDEDEIKCVKEPIPFGNPFKMIVRIKNSRLSNQQNDFISSEENYLNTNIHQGNKFTQNLLTNRLPKLKKLKKQFNQLNSQSSSPGQLSQGSTSVEQENGDSDQRLEGEIKKKIKQNEDHSSLIKSEQTSEDSQIYIIEKEDDDQQQTDSDPIIYDPSYMNTEYENQIQPEIEDSNNIYSPYSVDDSKGSTNNSQSKNIKNSYKIESEEEEYNPETTLYNSNQSNQDSQDYENTFDKKYDSFQAKNSKYENSQEEALSNLDKENNLEYTSDRILDFYNQNKLQSSINQTYEINSNYEPNISNKKFKLDTDDQVQPSAEDLDNEQGYNPDNDFDDPQNQFEEGMGSKKSSKQEKKKIKNYIHNDLVYDIRESLKNDLNNNDAGEDEYDPSLVNQQTNETTQQFTKIEFSTKYLQSPYRESHQFLLKNKNFFDNLLFIQKCQKRDDLKSYVTRQMKEITEEKFKAVFKQRVSEIVYQEKK